MTETPGWTPPAEPERTQSPPGGPGQQPPPGWSAQQPPAWSAQQQPGWGWAPPRPEVKPGIVPLRPLGVGEILDGAITCIRSRFKIMLGLAAVTVTVGQVLSLLLQATVGSLQNLDNLQSGPFGPSPPPSDASLSMVFGDLSGYLVVGIMSALLAGLVAAVVGDAVIGRTSTLSGTWGRVRPVFFSLLVAAFLAVLLPYIGLLAFLVGGVFLWAALGLAAPAVVLEQIGPFKALGRSWRLVLPSFWRVLGIRLLGWLIGLLVGMVLAVPFTVVGGVVLVGSGEPTGATFWTFMLLAALGGTLGGIVSQPFVAAVDTLLYVDQRMRREGLDLELARTAGVATATGQPGASPSP